MKSLLDPTFEYTHSTKTDVKVTFDRERKRLENAASLAELQGVCESTLKVTALKTVPGGKAATLESGARKKQR